MNSSSETFEQEITQIQNLANEVGAPFDAKAFRTNRANAETEFQGKAFRDGIIFAIIAAILTAAACFAFLHLLSVNPSPNRRAITTEEYAILTPFLALIGAGAGFFQGYRRWAKRPLNK